MFSDYISINKNFQTSVNLELDLDNENKISEYIPTSDICNVLRQYFRAFLGKDKSKATTLVGPYGKGKSFLLLILSYLTHGDPTSISYKNLLSKIKKIDSPLNDLIIEFHSRQMKFLPVVINSNYDDLRQSFRIALDQSLRNYDLNDIVPQSTYQLCLNLINNWENDCSLNQKMASQCKKEQKNIELLKKGLKEYSSKSFESFKSLYRCMTMGIDFNPLINDDISSTYSNILRELKDKHGFTGLFIIFDEFSKFINNATNISHDLKLIQDFAELSNRSSIQEQINICCVTHKSLNLYEMNDNKTRDSFKTVEGRFKEIRFNRSLEENYQIISGAIIKQNQSQINNFISTQDKLFQRVSQLNLISNKKDFETLKYGCFPLNPITTYCLIQISELIAQNERTLFTFLCDADENSFNSFLSKKSSGTLNIDALYDYFAPIMQSSDAERVNNIWIRTEAILNKTTQPIERSIIKSLSIIHIINDFDKLPPTTKTIAIALNIQENEVVNNIKPLLDNHFLKTDDYRSKYYFASSNSKEIDDQINMLLKTKFLSSSISSLLSRFNEEKFIIPRQYNEKYKMTRYYRVDFLTLEELLNLSSFNLLFEKEFSDGLVINLVTNSPNNPNIKKTIEEQVNRIKDYRVIIRLPNKEPSIYFIDAVKKCGALEMLSLSKEDNESIYQAETKLMFEESLADINKYLNELYNADSSFFAYISDTNYKIKNKEFRKYVNILMEKEFCKPLIFNNELVNKNNLTSQYQKPVNNIVNLILSGVEVKTSTFPYTETSPEMSVYNAVVKHFQGITNNKYITEVKNIIINKISSNPTTPVPVKDISLFLSSAPYGIRKGLHSLIIAMIIVSISDCNIILKLGSKEIDLNAENLSKAVYSSSEYSLSYTHSSIEQQKYVNNMFELFSIKKTENFRSDVKALSTEIRSFFLGLPKIVRNANITNNYLNLPSEIIQYKNLFISFNINASEIVLIYPEKMFGSYSKAFLCIKTFVYCWDKFLISYKTNLENIIRNTFTIDIETNLKTGINEWIKANIPSSKHLVLETFDDSLMQTIDSLSFNDQESVEKICYAVVGKHIEDWENDESKKIQSLLGTFKDNVINAKSIDLDSTYLQNLKSNNFAELSPLGIMLKENIKASFDEFGDSITKEEKVQIISDIMKELL